MGSLYWQLNDCWPVASWSSRDYYGNWKALHYTAQDVFAPVSLSLAKTVDMNFHLFTISDTTNVRDTLSVSTYKVSGELVSTYKKALDIQIGANLVETIPFCQDDEFMISSDKILTLCAPMPT